MKRPILWALFFVIAGGAGIYLCDEYHLGLLPLFAAIAAGIAAIAAAIAAEIAAARFRWAPVFIFILFYGIGSFRMFQSLRPANGSVERWVREGAEVTAAGFVRDLSFTQSGQPRVALDARMMIKASDTDNRPSDNRPPDDRLAQKTRMVISAILPEGESVEIGQGLTLTGVLEPLDRARNPGGFDEFLYYRARKIQYKSFASVEKKLEPRATFLFALNRGKSRLAAVYDAILPPVEASVMKSIILGDRADLDQTTQDLYRLAGIYHLLCVSGLHISILSMAIFWILGIFLNKRAAGAIALIALIVYCLFTGAGISTVRAVLMSGVVILGHILFRESDLLSSAAFAAICLILYEPLYILDIGFQLSFSAVIGIAVLSGPMERCLTRVWQRLPACAAGIKKAVSGNLAALCGTLPCLNYHFYLLTPYAFFVNLIILPTAGVLVITGAAAGAVGLFDVRLAAFLSGALYVLLKFYEAVCRFFVSLPFARVLTGSCGPALAVGMAILLLLFAAWWNSPPRLMPRKRICFWAASATFVLLAGWRARPSGLQITMLDVGQGDAFVIQSGGKTFVVDGGGLPNRPPGQNTGATVLTPYLDYIGVTRLDGVFVTHPDRDHIVGVLEMIPEKKIHAVYLAAAITAVKPAAADQSGDFDFYRDIIELTGANAIPVVYLQTGDKIEAGGLAFSVFYPPAPSLNSPLDPNETSLVFMLRRGDASMLFTGDIDAGAEEAILRSEGESAAACSALKLPHHGSKYSNSMDFLRAANPLIALVSTGRGNVYGHPARETLERLETFGIPLYNTAACGAVILRFSRNTIQIQTMLEESGEEFYETAQSQLQER
ncbi:MAG: DNA internalization-related competence protein ComEC/Rec2 [Clostridiales bacterium]|jgi:competence protein ComEC|nr:DNA internalization-related competence protein ComEC/Rec2 [Clostridiales bacterium]